MFTVYPCGAITFIVYSWQMSACARMRNFTCTSTVIWPADVPPSAALHSSKCSQCLHAPWYWRTHAVCDLAWQSAATAECNLQQVMGECTPVRLRKCTPSSFVLIGSDLSDDAGLKPHFRVRLSSRVLQRHRLYANQKVDQLKEQERKRWERMRGDMELSS